jgi:HAD superfamily hydrolase (TIGR01509 family)
VPRAVLWDLDGTLIDSRDYHWRAWRDTMQAEGVDFTETEFRESFGQRNEEILAGRLGPGAAADRIRRVGDAKEARYRTLLSREGIAPLPGAAGWVRTLHARGWRQAVASSAPRLNVEAVEAALGITDLMDAVVAAEDVDAGKPDPQVFLLAASRLDVPPARCVVVEDAAAGVEAARRAGMACIGVGGAEQADVSVGALTDLPGDVFDRLVREPRTDVGW